MAEIKEDEIVMLEHAREYFRIHAEQRMSLLRFSLIAYGAFIVAYGATIDRHGWVAVGVALLGVWFASVFVCLERRTRELVKIAEIPIQGRDPGSLTG